MCFQKKAEAQPNKDAPSVNRIRKEVATESHQIFKIAIHTCFLVRENRSPTPRPKRRWEGLAKSVETLVSF